MTRSASRTSEEPRFITMVKRKMEKENIETPNELYRMLEHDGPRGRGVARSTIQGYFGPEYKAPARWFVRAMVYHLRFKRREALHLYEAYVNDYA